MCNCRKKNNLATIKRLAKQYAKSENIKVAIYLKSNNTYDFIDYEYANNQNYNITAVINA